MSVISQAMQLKAGEIAKSLELKTSEQWEGVVTILSQSIMIKVFNIKYCQ